MKGLLRRARDSYRALSELQIIVIGSSRCLVLLWLVGVIALVLLFRQSFENRSNIDKRSHVFELCVETKFEPAYILGF